MPKIKKKKILILEDEKLLREMYNEKLSQAGFETFLADSAKEGLMLAEKEKPDLILLDILLLEGSGISFLKEFRQNKNNENVLVIAFSNFDDPDAKKAAQEFGAKEYLIKTAYTPKTIVEKIKKYLE